MYFISSYIRAIMLAFILVNLFTKIFTLKKLCPKFIHFMKPLLSSYVKYFCFHYNLKTCKNTKINYEDFQCYLDRFNNLNIVGYSFCYRLQQRVRRKGDRLVFTYFQIFQYNNLDHFKY